eukprot:7539492-Alexandrium_andersonii.AAC.1
MSPSGKRPAASRSARRGQAAPEQAAASAARSQPQRRSRSPGRRACRAWDWTCPGQPREQPAPAGPRRSPSTA